MSETFLVAVDGSPASRQALEYFARVVAPLDGVEVHLVHVVSAADPDAGGQASHAEARALLESLRDVLTAAGLRAASIDLGLLAHTPDTSLVDGLLDLARERDAGTIVMGRNSLPRYRETLHHHPADELVRRAPGRTVWVVA